MAFGEKSYSLLQEKAIAFSEEDAVLLWTNTVGRSYLCNKE